MDREIAAIAAGRARTDRCHSRDLARSGKKVKAFELIGEWADVRDPEILAQMNRKVA
jgi:hypothetical protein